VKVAFCHDWLNGMRGGEKCLEAMCEVYLDSPIYTLFCEKNKISGEIARHAIHCSPLESIRGCTAITEIICHFFHGQPKALIYQGTR